MVGFAYGRFQEGGHRIRQTEKRALPKDRNRQEWLARHKFRQISRPGFYARQAAWAAPDSGHDGRVLPVTASCSGVRSKFRLRWYSCTEPYFDLILPILAAPVLANRRLLASLCETITGGLPRSGRAGEDRVPANRANSRARKIRRGKRRQLAALSITVDCSCQAYKTEPEPVVESSLFACSNDISRSFIR